MIPTKLRGNTGILTRYINTPITIQVQVDQELDVKHVPMEPTTLHVNWGHTTIKIPIRLHYDVTRSSSETGHRIQIIFYWQIDKYKSNSYPESCAFLPHGFCKLASDLKGPSV
jgi:hypothetical protein